MKKIISIILIAFCIVTIKLHANDVPAEIQLLEVTELKNQYYANWKVAEEEIENYRAYIGSMNKYAHETRITIESLKTTVFALREQSRQDYELYIKNYDELIDMKNHYKAVAEDSVKQLTLSEATYNDNITSITSTLTAVRKDLNTTVMFKNILLIAFILVVLLYINELSRRKFKASKTPVAESTSKKEKAPKEPPVKKVKPAKTPKVKTSKEDPSKSTKAPAESPTEPTKAITPKKLSLVGESQVQRFLRKFREGKKGVPFIYPNVDILAKDSPLRPLAETTVQVKIEQETKKQAPKKGNKNGAKKNKK